jgi:hypothetical protein
VPAAQVGVDRHLLARHRVERKASRDLGHALASLGDHDELDQRQNQKDHRADDQIASDHEVAEALITSPASACSRIKRVDETLSPSRNSVVISKMLGKAAIFSALD